MPPWQGNGLGYGYGISGWYLSPYVLGDPGALAYGNWGSFGDYGENQPPYVDNNRPQYQGGPGGPGYDGSQGYGPEPGYQGAEYQSPGYQERPYQVPSYEWSQSGQQADALSSQPVMSTSMVSEAAVTLIFNDGRAPEHIHNYLLTAKKLTVLDANYRDIPLDQINMTATQEANKAAGIEFRTPRGSR